MTAVEQASTKHCPKCDTVKPLDQFPKDRGRADGRYPYCKPCHSGTTAPYREAAQRATRRLVDLHRADYDRFYEEEIELLRAEP